MNEKIHEKAAKAHFDIGNNYDSKFNKEKDVNLKKALMTVAAQNYFYSAINTIEAILARVKSEHSYNHENRFRKLLEHRILFSDEIITLFEKVDRDYRNKVAYRGKNGKLYADIKKLAKLLIENDKRND
ncbi:MAG: hypothetical protein ABIF40_05945 [archaeon]